MFEADKACGVVESAFFLVAPPRGGLSVAPRDPDRCWKQFMMFFGGDSVCGDDSFAIFQSHPRARPGAAGVRTPSLGLHVQGCQCTAVFRAKVQKRFEAYGTEMAMEGATGNV